MLKQHMQKNHSSVSSCSDQSGQIGMIDVKVNDVVCCLTLQHYGGRQVSGLFARDEIDEITQSLITPMKKEFPRHPPTQENLYNYFISRSRDNLHIVLCFSPVSTSHSLHVCPLCYTNNQGSCRLVRNSATEL